MIKLIASDIDGTLIQESTSVLYPEIVEEIHSLTHRGILFCAASGRQLPSIRNVFCQLDDEVCYLADNGACLMYQGEIFSVTPMDRSMAGELVRELRRLGPDYEVTISTAEGCLVETRDPVFLDLMENGYHNTYRVVEDVMAVDAPILKVAVHHTGGIRRIGEEEMIPRWGGRLKVCVAGGEWVDFMERTVDKGNGLRRIQERFHILPEETLSFGDNSNDIGLLEAARYSYAVENATPDVLAAASAICPSYHRKGVYQTIRELVDGV